MCQKVSAYWIGDQCVYCDGFQCSASGSPILVDHDTFYRTLLGGGCLGALEQDGGSFPIVGGIWDTDLDPAATQGSYPEALLVGGCDDVGGGFDGAGDGGMNYAAPTGSAQTVAQALQAKVPSGVTLYGVVTAGYPWNVSPPRSGLLYLQDLVRGGPPIAGSGVAIYIGDKVVASAPGLGSSLPQRGEVIELTSLDWHPYNGVNEFAISSSTVLTQLGTAPLPPPVSLPASELVSGSMVAASYKGMRVVVSNAPCVMTDFCPVAMSYPSN